MQISTKQLRMQPGRIISIVNKGQDITVTYRGKPSVRIIPIENRKAIIKNEYDSNDELFGLWKNRKDIDDVEDFTKI